MSHHITLSKKTSLLLAALFVLIGVGVLAFGIVQWQRARASESWPTVEGVILSAEIDGTHMRRTGDRTVRNFIPIITYEYTVGGEAYVNDTISFAQPSSDRRSKLRPVLDRYPVGSTVIIHHHPNTPAIAVLEPGITAGVYFILLFGAVWTLGSLTFLAIFATKMPADE